MRDKVLCQPSKHGNKYVFDKTNSYFWLNPGLNLEGYLTSQKEQLRAETNKAKRAVARMETDVGEWIHQSQIIL